jgi:molecular chaperone Hsp33
VILLETEEEANRPLRFSIAERHARGRLLRLDNVLNAILAAHNYPPIIERILAEALVLTALLALTLKDAGGQLTLQAQTESGAIDLLVCDFKEGGLRGYVKFAPEKLVHMPPDATLFALFGKGYLAITFDQARAASEGGGRYQGIVPLEGTSLAGAVEYYFVQSEQLPTLIRVAIHHIDGPDGRRCIAGGMMIQHLADGEDGRERLHVRLDHPEWEHVAALGGSISNAELTDMDLPLEDIVWRLFHEESEIRVESSDSLARGCRCDASHIRDVISRFPPEDRADMVDDSGDIVVNCEFCSRNFPVSLISFNN